MKQLSVLGPLTWYDDNESRVKLVGIVSRGDGKFFGLLTTVNNNSLYDVKNGLLAVSSFLCAHGKPDFYTNVAKLLEWINEITGK